MHELQLLNEHQLSNVHDTLMNDLTIHVQQHTQRRIELVLYENTKLKLDRAMQRHESDLKLTRIISDALSNAELLWIAIQLDCDKKRNCLTPQRSFVTRHRPPGNGFRQCVRLTPLIRASAVSLFRRLPIFYQRILGKQLRLAKQSPASMSMKSLGVCFRIPFRVCSIKNPLIPYAIS